MLKAMIAAALVTAPTTISAQQPVPVEKAPKEKKICKREAPSSTSRLRKNICRTASEWEAARQSDINANDLRRMGAN